jgi:hypothetical protein
MLCYVIATPALAGKDINRMMDNKKKKIIFFSEGKY